MNLCERVSMFDGFAPTYTLEQWVNYNSHPTGGLRRTVSLILSAFPGENLFLGCELQLGDSVYRDAKEITKQWKLYFEKLYTPSNIDNFDPFLERCVYVKINELKSRLSEIPPHDIKLHPEDVIIQYS